MKHNGIVVLSLFDGMSCGMLALERAGIKVDKYFASEIDKHATKVSKANYPNIIRLGDVQCINYQMLPKIDLLIGGFPCQSYSQAGKRGGIKSSNGQLIYDVFNAINETKPKDIMLENVKGLLSIDKGETFKYILKQLNDCGYAVDFRTINSSLVSAQNRQRVYIMCKSLNMCKGKTYNSVLSKEFINATLKESSHKGFN